MRPATKRRIRWAIGIGLMLIAVLIGMLTLVDLTAPVEEAKRCAPNIWQSQWPKYIGCTMAVHEGFAAGLIGAAGALFAAWLAFDAIQEQLADEREREQLNIVRTSEETLRKQSHAKAVATLCLKPSINVAAAALAAIDKALHARSAEERRCDELVELMANYAKSTLESPTIMEACRDLGVQDRLYYLAIIATMRGFVDVCLMPSPVVGRIKGLQTQQATLMSLHHHLRGFDANLANIFARDSGTNPANAPSI